MPLRLRQLNLLALARNRRRGEDAFGGKRDQRDLAGGEKCIADANADPGLADRRILDESVPGMGERGVLSQPKLVPQAPATVLDQRSTNAPTPSFKHRDSADGPSVPCLGQQQNGSPPPLMPGRRAPRGASSGRRRFRELICRAEKRRQRAERLPERRMQIAGSSSRKWSWRNPTAVLLPMPIANSSVAIGNFPPGSAPAG
jgi:hypothetical protein